MTTRAPEPNDLVTCAVELSDVVVQSEAWWTLGFEAAGGPDRLRSAIEATAERVFDEATPSGIQLPREVSGAYSAWLGRLAAHP